MSIKISPYHTTVGKHFVVKDTEQAIRQVMGRGYNWIKVNEVNKTIYIYPNDVINKFDHPLLVETVKGLVYTAVDLTAFVRENREGEYTVANRSLYLLQTLRAAITSEVLENGPRMIKSLPTGVLRSYTDLITNSISMAFSLNSEEIIVLKVLSAWMYYSMLSEQEVIGDMELQAVIAKLARDTGIPSNFFVRYIDGATFDNVEEFLEVVKSKITNPALQKLNLGLFYTVVAKNLNSSVWIGLEKQQLLAVSIEHIPSFVATLVMCLSEPVFKNAGLTKIAMKNLTRDRSQFILSVTSMANPE